MARFTLNSTVSDVEKYFGTAGGLLFPVDRPFNPTATLAQISNSAHYIWYSNIHATRTVEILNYLANQQKKRQIFYPIYSEDEIAAHLESS
ncbi:hypothetical protein NGP02_17375 (plasmid) [Lactiplantibacillus pentosus]|uniref:hypothetical protein n=1 Tax=Lactiplantibacillus pentosus TaxID=1589 RepID=UPI0020917747|nr:hypothetical protein [Lactiplantibacillus pentosus]WMB65153.1 hypothetical protein NGP02_17375 [Lactiplantibacillus pentosus]